jgi:hypothetical protein
MFDKRVNNRVPPAPLASPIMLKNSTKIGIFSAGIPFYIRKNYIMIPGGSHPLSIAH